MSYKLRSHQSTTVQQQEAQQPAVASVPLFQIRDDDDRDSVSIPSTWKKIRQPASHSVQTDSLVYAEESVQTPISSFQSLEKLNKEVQAQLFSTVQPREEGEWKIYRDDGEPLLRFLQRHARAFEVQLERNIQSHAFDYYTVSWGNEIDSVACLHCLQPTLSIKADNYSSSSASDINSNSNNSNNNSSNNIRGRPLNRSTKSTSNISSSDGTAGLSCTSLSWNSTGYLLAAAYGRVDLVGWCFERGYLCVWNLMKRDINSRKSDFTIEVESYLMCIEFHPDKPNLIAGGTYNGCVQVWNLSPITDGEDNLFASSGTRINSVAHRDPVTQIKWVQNKRDDSYLIASLSGDGKILLWSLSNKLATPISGYALSVSRGMPIGGSAMCFSYTTATTTTSTTSGGKTSGGGGGGFSSRAKVASIESPLVVATESGNIFKCTLSAPPLQTKKQKEELLKKPPLQNPIRFTFEDHFGYIHSIDCSPFHRNAFLSCSSDGSIAIYNLLERKCVLRLEPSSHGEYLYAACWSPFRPLVLAAASQRGILYVYDLQQSYMEPVVKLDVAQQSGTSNDDGGSNKSAAILSIGFNPVSKDLIATGDDRGVVRVWQLNHDLTSSKDVQREVAELGRLIEHSFVPIKKGV